MSKRRRYSSCALVCLVLLALSGCPDNKSNPAEDAGGSHDAGADAESTDGATNPTVPPEWTCPEAWYALDECICGCGVLNEACGGSATLSDCSEDTSGCMFGESVDAADLTQCVPDGSTRYVSSGNGDNSNDGRTRQTAWRDVTMLDSVDFAAVATILFERGSTWDEVALSFENIGAAESPIVFAAYGRGDRPRLYGSKVITNAFQPDGADRWVVTDPGLPDPIIRERTALAHVFIDDVLYQDSREPNAGFFELSAEEGASNATRLRDSTQAWSTDQWAGGYVTIRTRSWEFSQFTIGSNNNTELYAAAGDSLYYGPQWESWMGNYGGRYYLIRNHANACDLAGEWAHSGQQLVINWPSDINSARVEATVSDVILRFTRSYVALHGLTIQRANQLNIDSYLSELSVDDCEIGYSGAMWIWSREEVRDGWEISDTSLSVTNSSFSFANRAGIYAEYVHGGTISGNTFRDTAHIPAVVNMRHHIEDNPQIQATAAIHNQRNTAPLYVQYNEFRNVGIAYQTHWAQSDWYFEYNLVDGYCQSVGDCGAIYCGGDFEDHDKQIRHNILLNANMDGRLSYEGGQADSHAIYYDYSTAHVSASQNSILNASQAVYFHVCSSNTFSDNTIYNGAGVKSHPSNSSVSLDNMSYGCGGGEGAQVRNNTVTGNRIVLGHQSSTDEVGVYFLIRSESSSDGDCANRTHEQIIADNTVDNNVYFTPFSGRSNVLSHGTDYGYATLEELGWNGLDGNGSVVTQSFDAGLGIDPSEYVTFLYNATSTSSIVCVPHVYRDLDGVQVSGTVAVPAWGSVVLFYEGAGAGCP